MGKKRFYDAVRDLIRDVHDPIEEPARTRPRLSIASLLAGPQTCAACWDPVPDEDPVFACNNCLGAYCPSCLEQYARTALKDRQMLPLRCADQQCRAPVPLSGLRGLLSQEEIALLSRFQCDLLRSPDDALEDTSETSSSESSPADDRDDEALESLMGTMGWRRCPDCGTGIERTQGCSHMICVCGGEFCYSCGERWLVGGLGCPRRCGLPQLHEDMLGMFPARFEELREAVWVRLAALLGTFRAAECALIPPETALRFHRQVYNPMAIQRTAPGEEGPYLPRVELPERPLATMPLTRMRTRSLTRVASRNETRPVKMRLRSLVHPSRENRL